MRVVVGQLAGQDYSIALPGRAASSRLVVLLHGAGYGWAFANDASADWDELREVVRYLAERDYAVLCLQLYDFSLTGTEGQTWGNDASTTQLAAAIAAAKLLPGVSSGRYALVGLSMGNVTAANHARRVSQSGIAGLLGIIPASDIQTHRGTDAAQGAFYAPINAALGVANDAGFAVAKATHNPPAIAPSITVPWTLWYNGDDPTVPAADVTALAALVPGGNGAAVNLGTGGHDFNNVTGSAVHAWLEGLSWDPEWSDLKATAIDGGSTPWGFDATGLSASATLTRATADPLPYAGASYLKCAISGGDGGSAFSRGQFTIALAAGATFRSRLAVYLPAGWQSAVVGSAQIARHDPFPTLNSHSGLLYDQAANDWRLFLKDNGADTDLTGRFAIPEGRWVLLEVQTLLSTSATGWARVFLDGALVAEGTGIKTLYAADPNVTRFRYGLVAIGSAAQGALTVNIDSVDLDVA